MKEPFAPEPGDTYIALKDLISVCYQSIEGAFLSTRDLYDREKWERDDPWFHAAHIRRYTAENLLRLECGFNITKVGNCGLRLSGNNYIIKLLKGKYGLPDPKTKAQRSYNYQRFHEPLQLGFIDLSGNIADTATVELKLVMLWQATHSFDFKKLSLALPKGDGRDGGGCYWSMTIPNPVESFVSATPPPVDDEVLDLPLEYADDDAGDAGDAGDASIEDQANDQR